MDFELRRDLQRLVDWLFSRVDRRIPDAVALLNDLVRVCILLASHAPVSTIINGHVPKPTTGKVGDVIDLELDKGKVRVGMRVAVFSGLNVAVPCLAQSYHSLDNAQLLSHLATEGQFIMGKCPPVPLLAQCQDSDATWPGGHRAEQRHIPPAWLRLFWRM